MTSCTFCRIMSRELGSSVVYEDNDAIACLDIQPITNGHLLVIPKHHYQDLNDLDPAIGAHMFKIGQQLSKVLQSSALKCTGTNLFLANGKTAMQEILHVHLHVIPRYPKDGFGLKYPPSYGPMASRYELEKLAGTIRNSI